MWRTDAELRKTLEELSEKLTESQRQEMVSVANIKRIIYSCYSKQDVGFQFNMCVGDWYHI